jgi:hypothetical protein
MRQGKYIVKKGRFIHVDDLDTNVFSFENLSACFGIVVFMYLAFMA